MTAKLNVRVDLHDLRQWVDNSAQRVRKAGWRSLRMSVGAFVLTLETMRNAITHPQELIDDAAIRGEKLETSASAQISRLEQRVESEGKRWQRWMTKPWKLVQSRVTKSGQMAEEEIEQQVARVLGRLGIPNRERLDKLTHEIESLSAKIDQELAQRSEHETPAV